MSTEQNKSPPVVAGFPITADTNLTRHGEHSGLRYRIANHGRYEGDQSAWLDRSRGTWCYYVYIPEELLPPDEFEKFWLPPSENKYTRSSGIYHPTYDYYGHAWAEADWHGGVTWYAKLGGLDGAQRIVEIGCDFAHSWDHGYIFDYAQVEREAKRTVDILVRNYPFYSRCSYTGKCLPKEQMVEHDGRFYTPEGLKEMQDWRTESKGAA